MLEDFFRRSLLRLLHCLEKSRLHDMHSCQRHLHLGRQTRCHPHRGQRSRGEINPYKNVTIRFHGKTAGFFALHPT